MELPIHNAPQSAHNTRDMILQRAQIAFDAEAPLVEEILDALASSGLPWLSPNTERMDIEYGINDFDTHELEWLVSLTRNAKSVLGSTLVRRFETSEAWNGHEITRELQIMVRILSVVQEFRKLGQVVLLALENIAAQDSMATLVIAMTTWYAPFEGMGILPQLTEALAFSVRTQCP
jgi:hypothetical protein